MVGDGQTLDGTYRLERLIGAGGMGAVYEAAHARLAGRYAIKVLLPELAARPEIRARFEREARVTSQLQHPNIVQVIDTNTTADGTPYFVMELLAGESLAERLARLERLAAPVVVDIVDQIAAGLAAAHARGVVHRDLKPDNVFLVPVAGRANDVVKILDFGISKVSGIGDPTDHEICGTPLYMAPEQVEGRSGDVDGATDQYALAVIAYELLTGANPFVASTMEEVFERVQAGNVLPTAVGGGLVDAVLSRAMARDGRQRFASVTDFAEAFRAAARVEAAGAELAAIVPVAPLTLAPRPDDGPRPATAARRRRHGGGRVRLGFAAAAAIAITSFFGMGAARRAPAPAAATSAVARTVVEPVPRPAAQIAVTEVAPPPEAPPASEAPEVRPPSARTSRPRATHADRPRWTIPTPPATVKPRPALPPDEDATMAPSDL